METLINGSNVAQNENLSDPKMVNEGDLQMNNQNPLSEPIFFNSKTAGSLQLNLNINLGDPQMISALIKLVSAVTDALSAK